jgi:hypothetical protein
MKATRYLLLLCLFAIPARADTIYLNNGQPFRGVLVRVTGDTIVIDYGHGALLDFPVSQIDRVVDDTGAVLFRDGAAVPPRPSRSDGAGGVYFDESGRRRSPGPASEALTRGSYAIGGLVSLSSSGGNIYRRAFGMEQGERQNLFAVAPSFTFFLADRIGLGLDLLYRREWFTDHSEDQFAVGPRVIWAFPGEGAVRPYVAGGVGLLRWRFGEEGEYSEVGMTARAGLGAFYFLSGRYAATIDVAYRWDRFDPELAVDPITGDSILLSVGLTGFLY